MRHPTRRLLLAAAPALALAPRALGQTTYGLSAAPVPLSLSGKLVQSGYVIGRTAPRAKVLVDDDDVGEASEQGLFVIGFDRDARATCRLEVQTPDASVLRFLKVAPTPKPHAYRYGNEESRDIITTTTMYIEITINKFLLRGAAAASLSLGELHDGGNHVVVGLSKSADSSVS